MNINKGAALPRELHLSQKPDSSATRHRYRPGIVVGNEGLSIQPFSSRETLGEGARGALETNFRRTLMYIRHGTPETAIIGMRKFSMLMHQLDEKQLWRGLETLKGASSDFERGNELQYNAETTLGKVESELWVRLGALAETGKNKDAGREARINAFKDMEWLYPMLIRHLADQTKPKEAIVGDAQEDGKVAAGLPALNAKAIRVAMEEHAKEHAASMRPAALAVEEKMADAILQVATSGKEDEKVCDAAFHALNEIDSPVLTRMLNKTAWYAVPDKGSELDIGPEVIHPEFDLDALEPMMIIRMPGDRRDPRA